MTATGRRDDGRLVEVADDGRRGGADAAALADVGDAPVALIEATLLASHPLAVRVGRWASSFCLFVFFFAEKIESNSVCATIEMASLSK